MPQDGNGEQQQDGEYDDEDVNRTDFLIVKRDQLGGRAPNWCGGDVVGDPSDDAVGAERDDERRDIQLRHRQGVDRADDSAKRQRRRDCRDGILRFASHDNCADQHGQLHQRPDREINAASQNDEGFAERQRTQKRALPQHVEQVAVREETV
jgi:hypothetical protein